MARKAVGIKLAAVFSVLALTWSLTATGQPAFAQTPAPAPGTSAALSVSPPTSALDATPGKSMTQDIGLDNISDEDRTVTVEVQNFSPTGEEGQAQLTQGEGQYALSQWISVSPQGIKIPAHGHQVFHVTINVPKDAPPGGHFGAIVFSPNGGAASGGAALSVVSQVTSLILLRVPGNATEKASIAGVNVCKVQHIGDKEKETKTCDKGSSFFQTGPLMLTARIQNSGNVQVAPSGTITIYNMFGSKVKTLKVDPKNALPDSVRRLDTKWSIKGGFGIYKAKFDLTYGSNVQELRTDKSITILPLKTIGAGVVGLVVLFLIFWLPRKRLKKAFRALTAAD